MGIEWEGRGEGWEENKKEGKRRGPQKLVHTPDVRHPEKSTDCKTDLIGGGSNTDVCPGDKHPRAAADAMHLALTCAR